MDLETGLQALLVVSFVAAAAPFVCALLARFRVPQVVVLIVGGILIGPEVIGLAEPQDIGLVANIGLGFLFLLAGYELELDHFLERAGRLAVAGWLVSAAISIAVTGLLAAAGLVHAFVPVALALTTTALGTLLPILRDNDMLDGPLGRFIMPAGAVGEFFPIVGIAVFLGSRGRLFGLISLVVMCVVALGLVWLPRLARLDRFEAISRQGEHATSQTTLRLTIMLLLGLLVFASDVGLDAVLGAFLAGVVLRRWAPGTSTPWRTSSTRSATGSSSRSSSSPPAWVWTSTPSRRRRCGWWPSSCCCSWCAASRPSSSTATTSWCANGSR